MPSEPKHHKCILPTVWYQLWRPSLLPLSLTYKPETGELQNDPRLFLLVDELLDDGNEARRADDVILDLDVVLGQCAAVVEHEGEVSHLLRSPANPGLGVVVVALEPSERGIRALRHLQDQHEPRVQVPETDQTRIVRFDLMVLEATWMKRDDAESETQNLPTSPNIHPPICCCKHEKKNTKIVRVIVRWRCRAKHQKLLLWQWDVNKWDKVTPFPNLLHPSNPTPEVAACWAPSSG